MTHPQSLGKRIGWYRRAEGMSRRRLAALAGIHIQTLARLESDEDANAQARTLHNIASALGVTSAHLLGEVGLLDGIDARVKDTSYDG